MPEGFPLKNPWISRLPNVLTALRILLTPVFLYFLFSDGFPGMLLAVLVFLIASTTDAYDGYLARKYNVTSEWGKFVDPLADKILVLSAFGGLWYLELFPFWMFLLIALRDVVVTGLRMVMRAQGTSMETSNLAKSKTAVQMVALYLVLTILLVIEWPFFSFLHYDLRWIIDHGGIWILMLGVTLLTVVSGMHYLYVNRTAIRQSLFA